MTADAAGPPAPNDLDAEATPVGRRLLRGFLSTQAVCLLIAALLALGGMPWWRAWVHSTLIGTGCWAAIDGGRHLLVAALRRRGLPDSPAARAGWPGWRWMLPLIAAGTLVGVGGGQGLARLLLPDAALVPGATGHGAGALGGVLAISLLAGSLLSGVMWWRGRLHAAEAAAQRAARAATEARLALLQSQLEPHMLFNTLANLRVLISLDPPRAQAMLDRLIAFLRATLDASRAGRHTLTDEFARTDDYLALMAVRMGPRLQARLDLPPELAAVPVPALLLQPLVENAVRHGLEPQVAGGLVEVRATRHGDRLRLSVRDTGVGLSAAGAAPRGDAGGGFGLHQVRERLTALHGDDATLTLSDGPGKDGGTLAVIDLPCPPCPTPPP